MKKHLLAIAIAIAMTLSIPLTALATINGQSLSEFSTLLDITYSNGNGNSIQHYKSYAFVPEGRSTLKWNPIKSGDLTFDFKWDISKLIKKSGKLILSQLSDNTAQNVNDCENAEGYAVYTITGVTPNPAKINKSKISYSETEAFVDIGNGNEWSKDGFVWSDGECSVPLSSSKQTVFVRGKADTVDADNITLPSPKSVKVTIPAMPKAPKVNIYLSQGFLSTRNGMEVSNDGKTWAKMDGNTLSIGVVTELQSSNGGGIVEIDLSNDKDVYIRVPAVNGKPPSNAFETRLNFKDAGDVSANLFTAAPNMKIKVDQSVVIEAYIGGKWKKVKSIDADSIPPEGLRVRRAGTKDRLPGNEGILKLDNQEIMVN